jgi:hypothetical protein
MAIRPMDTDMKKTNSAKTKAAPKLRDLTAKRNPKGGRSVTQEGINLGSSANHNETLGTSPNHNETLVCDSNR